MGLTFSHTIQGQVLVIQPHGKRLDAMNASLFKENVLSLIQTTGCCKLVFDLSEVQFIDSSALGAFLAIQRILSKQKGALRLAHLNKNIQTMFEIVSMHRILNIFAVTEEAIKSF